MRILSASVKNFASYKDLEFNFQNQGLTLIQGPTGSGKSTLCDLVPWLAFGRTAKGGTVDEVLSWPGEDVCKGTLCLTNVTIHRSRGPKAKDNDLYYTFPDDGYRTMFRGRDLSDTQKMLNVVLGMDYDLYLAGAYIHEFSQTSQFFTTTAKNRRTICEQLVDLTLVKKLQVKLSEEHKILGKMQQTLQTTVTTIENTVNTLLRIQVSENNKAKTWEESHARDKEATIQRYEQFEAGRKKLVSKKCPVCSTVLIKPKTIIDDSVNPYISRLEELNIAANPYTEVAKDYSTEIHLERDKLSGLEDSIKSIEQQLGDIEILQQVANDFRSVSISNTISSIEYNTNELLTKHFDGEIRVKFDVAEADKLDVEIYKDGNAASFTQLSKGQRCLLKLCSGVSVMQAVQNHHGISFDQVFMDEALDGLDDTMKIKAYGLLEMLSQSYGSVFVVEHSEALKACFPNTYTVELVNGESQIQKT